MDFIIGIVLGGVAWFFFRCVLLGFYTVDQNQRAVMTTFGRAERLQSRTIDTPIAGFLRPDERERYNYPMVRVIPPGGPYFKMPWQSVRKVSIATSTINMALDLENPAANENGQRLEAVTRDQLNTGLTGQIRYRVSEANLYAYLFGIKQPIIHVMAYFVSVLRQRIADFQAKQPVGTPDLPFQDFGVSINDLRKNLRELNEFMELECRSAEARYGVQFDASLITGIDPPAEVETALAAINTAHNQVSSDISLAQAHADQRIELSKRAVEIETLRSQAEVEPIRALAAELLETFKAGPGVLRTYVRNVRLILFDKAQNTYLEMEK